MPDEPRTITVTGTGRASVRPDLADLRLGVTITAPTVESARIRQLDHPRRGDREPQGDSASRTETSRPRSSRSARSTTTRARARRRASSGTRSRTSSPRWFETSSASARPIDAALTAGCDQCRHIAFRVADQSAAEREAREGAVADARVKAETFAGGGGGQIAGVAAIVESGAPIPYPSPIVERMAFAAKDARTPIEPGTNEVVATVTIAYLIGTG